MGFGPAALGAERQVEDVDKDRALEEDADVADPEVDRRERLQAFAEVDDERTADRGDEAEQRD